MVEVEFDPTTRTTLRNGSTLGLHIVEKGFQTGGFLALTLFVPIAAIRGYRATGAWAVLGAKALETGARSAAITTLLTGGCLRVSEATEPEGGRTHHDSFRFTRLERRDSSRLQSSRARRVLPLTKTSRLLSRIGRTGCTTTSYRIAPTSSAG